jgi:hypothetical protein
VAKLKFEQNCDSFYEAVNNTLNYLQTLEDRTHYKTVTTLITDNIKLTERIKELEDESDGNKD